MIGQRGKLVSLVGNASLGGNAMRQQAHERTRCHRLPAARFTHDADSLTVADRQVDVGYDVATLLTLSR
jgi:hypothetical protein